MLEILSNGPEIIEISKAVLAITLGVLIGFILKKSVYKIIDSFLLKKIFKKDLSAYETSSIMNRILTEIIQWSIILLAFHYALVIIQIDLFTNIFMLATAELPRILIFILIIFIGILFSKVSATWIKSKNIKNKEEISTILELVISTAFILSSLEYVGVKATALIELFKVILYTLAVLIIILIVKPELIIRKAKN